MAWRLPLGDDWWQKMLQSPVTAEVENSITLRVLVLALIIVSVVATDVAAETWSSFWAVPLSILGSIWGYYRRRDRNIPVKFCIAIEMLVALGAFLGRLMGELNDTRLDLAEFLIQVQVLHCFDVSHRKDLGDSVIVGLILLSVAAKLSQALAFASVLLLFLARPAYFSRLSFLTWLRALNIQVR
ncbi:hypothetical protein NIES4106_38240 [Fischerella sp. NIES-4106]|nr:hypothetical protein NIES4106_38240 [Fischerella sp. NIES-4106]